LADIFNEVDEEVRREQLQKLWSRYGIYLIAMAVVVICGIGGWRAYGYLEAKKAAEAGASFEAAMRLADEGKAQEAEAAFAKLADQTSPGYRALARLRAAAEITKRDSQAAIAAYDAIAADTSLDRKLRGVATLRAGFLLLDANAFDGVKSKVEPLTGPSGTFRHSARELLALAAWRANDAASARRWAEMIVGDSESPPSLRTRMEMLLALAPVAGNG
jgi:hypothetical protein